MNEDRNQIKVKIEGEDNPQMDLPLGEELKTEIIKKHIEPSYRNDIISLLDGKKCWRLSGQIFETVSKVCVAVGSVASFAAGYYDEKLLSFISGAISVFSLAALQFSTFSYRENKKQSQELNILLKKLSIDSVPILARGVDSTLYRSTIQRDEKVEMGLDQEQKTIPLEEYNRVIKEYEEFKKDAYKQGEKLTKELEMAKVTKEKRKAGNKFN